MEWSARHFPAVAMVTAVSFVVMLVAGFGVALGMAAVLALLVVGTWLGRPRRRRNRCEPSATVVQWPR
jgi:membrane protein implicated in regulation of membrane protease activity